MTTSHAVPGAGTDPARQWPGIYLAKVVQTRLTDLSVRMQVPQVLGTAVTDWAAPMLDPRGTGNPPVGTQFAAWGLGWQPEVPPGPGPPVNTLVVAMFLGGDINVPVYSLLGRQS